MYNSNIISIAFQQVFPSSLARLTLFFLLSFAFFRTEFRFTQFFTSCSKTWSLTTHIMLVHLPAVPFLILSYHLEQHGFTIFMNHSSVSDQLLRLLVSLNTDFNLHHGARDSDFVSHAILMSKFSLPWCEDSPVSIVDINQLLFHLMPRTTLRHKDAFIMQFTEILKLTLSDRNSPSLHMDTFLFFFPSSALPLLLPCSSFLCWGDRLESLDLHTAL